ncbi:MAG: LETM1 domain-containing protein [Myxococcaceae bacterium]|nr:LETM1 domain-containing protein [Myxococcaceae bacterium]MCI0670981.1 LETM1 domain-containing protein [Myxococcaceae bacterium]
MRSHVPPVPPPGASGLTSGRARARAYVGHLLRESGLLYGTPATPAQSHDVEGQPPEDALFLAVMGTFARIALDVAHLMGAADGPRREQLLLLFASLSGRVQDAEALDAHLRARPGTPAPRRLWAHVEDALEKRAVSLGGDPVFGLVLHNGAVYADAQLWGRQALDYFARGHFQTAGAARRAYHSAREKALLAEVLTALACVERTPSYATRRAIRQQVEDLRLPSPLDAELKAAVSRAFARRRPVADIVRQVRSAPMRRLVLEQALLASLVDGRRSLSELAFLRELAAALRVPPGEVERIELEVAEFYVQNRHVVDVFTIGDAAGVLGDERVGVIHDALKKNFHRLMQEVRETGDLSVLLARAARGHSLTPGERRRMREQLLDVARVIPALAIFAAPGGLFLLIALTKLLGINLLPSAFRDEEPEVDARPTGS